MVGSSMEESTTVDLQAGNILYLLLAQPDRLQFMNRALIKHITDTGFSAVIISLNQPAKILLKQYRKDGIDASRIYIVDAVSKFAGGACEPHPHIRYVPNPSNLTDLGIGIIDILRKIPPEEQKCVVFDSVSTLLIYANSGSTSKFIHFIANKLKLEDVSAIFLCMEKGVDPGILSSLSVFVDKVLDCAIASAESCLKKAETP